jgi:glycosyltransferase involved in cell wall biosynthesis
MDMNVGEELNKKPKALLILPFSIYPPDGGGKLLALNNLKMLGKYFEVHLLVRFPQEAHHQAGLVELGKICILHVVREGSDERKAGYEGMGVWVSRLKWFLCRVFSVYPMADINEFYAEPLVRQLIQADFPLIQVEHSWWYHHALRQRQARLVVVEHNLECEFWRQRGLSLMRTGSIFVGLCYYLGAIKIFFQERAALKDADLVLACSDKERVKIERTFRIPGKIHDQRFGMFLADYQSFLRPARTLPPGTAIRLIFVGSLDSAESEDAIVFFIEEILPCLRAAMLKVSLALVGRNPSSALKKRIKFVPEIQLVGTVPDVRPYIADADIYIVPLRFGAGIRIKILEAMALGKPIVSTTKGAEGVMVEGSGTIIADGPSAFAQAIFDLSRDDKLRADMSGKSLAMARESYDWEMNFNKELLPLYRKLLS